MNCLWCYDTFFKSKVDYSTCGSLKCLGCRFWQSSHFLLLRHRFDFNFSWRLRVCSLYFLKIQSIGFYCLQKVFHCLLRKIFAFCNNNTSELTYFNSNLIYISKFSLVSKHNINILTSLSVIMFSIVSLFLRTLTVSLLYWHLSIWINLTF